MQKIGVFVCWCGSNIAGTVDVATVVEAVRLLVIRQQGGNKLTAEALENYPADMPQQALVAAFRKYNK